MPSTTTTKPKATAKNTLSTLKGDLVVAKGDLIMAKRSGNPEEVDSVTNRISRLEYAIAAVSTFKHSGKSALKAAAALPRS